MANPVCTIDTLISGGACYANLDSRKKLAVFIYLGVLELAAIGGTNYSATLTTTLVTDSTCYKNLTLDEVGQRTIGTAELVMAANHVTTAGGTVPATINLVIAAARCLFNFPEAMLMAMLTNVTCKLGVHKHYTQ